MQITSYIECKQSLYCYFQEASLQFITAENLELEIEKALNKTVNYNFAIDLQGNRHVEKSDKSAEVVTDFTDTKPHMIGVTSEALHENQEAKM